MYSLERGFEMNDEMAIFLQEKPGTGSTGGINMMCICQNIILIRLDVIFALEDGWQLAVAGNRDGNWKFRIKLFKHKTT